MKKILIFAFVAVTVLAVKAQPEQMSDEDMASRKTEMVQRKAEKFAKDFDLKDDAKTQFIELYKQYQNDLDATQEKPDAKKEGDQKAQKGENKEKKELTNEEATAKVNEYFERQEEMIKQMQSRLDVEKKYYEKFKKTLTPQQLAKIFRQNRMRMGQQNGQQRGGQRGGFGGPEGGFPGGGNFGGPGF